MDRKWYSALEIPHILECWETLGIDEKSISKAKQAAINPLLNLNFRDVKPENFVAFVDNDRNKPRSLETVPIDHKSVIPGQLAILLFSNVTSFENTAPEFMILEHDCSHHPRWTHVSVYDHGPPDFVLWWREYHGLGF